MEYLEQFEHLRLTNDAVEILDLMGLEDSSNIEDLDIKQGDVLLVRVFRDSPSEIAYLRPVTVDELMSIIFGCGGDVRSAPGGSSVWRIDFYNVVEREKLEKILELVRLAAIGRAFEAQSATPQGVEERPHDGLGIEDFNKSGRAGLEQLVQDLRDEESYLAQ